MQSRPEGIPDGFFRLHFTPNFPIFSTFGA